MKSLIVISAVSVALLSGCDTTHRLEAAAKYSSDVGDQALSINEYGVCKLPSIRAIMERYGTSADRLLAWQDFCWPELSRVFPQVNPTR